MKRFALKTVSTVGYVGVSAGAGWLFGKVFSILFRKIWTEEFKENKPVIFWMSVILYYLLLAAFSVAWALASPLAKIYELVDSKIDDLADEKEWD